ncbi:hypothetical protein F2Q69_00021886 [Brassica cretica]|uniref:Uncharacterized protein n=1 Tax=Brassica cretica TaxID=69181 RepID=A0A8S9PTT9_BRACR|nr:hypothetical protein F2Q69_00021886 [Brassica cretica]
MAKNLIYSLVLGFHGYQGFYGFDWHFTEVSKPDPCPRPLLVVFDLSFKVSKYQLGMDRLLSSSWTVSCARHGPWNLVGPLSHYGLQGHSLGFSEH